MNIYRQQASLLKLMAHPMRLQILDVLRSGNECVCHLSAALDKPQPYISQQLAILRNGGAIVDEREGTNIFYHLADANVAHVVEAACSPASATDRGEAVIARRVIARRVIGGCHCPKCVEAAPDRG